MNLAAQDPSPLVDTHAHLDDPRLRANLDDLLKRAGAAGVCQIIAIGTTAATSSDCVELAQAYRGLFAAVGIHPNDAAAAGEDDWRVITDLLDRPGVVAVGETGLDRYWDRTPFGLQQQWFDRHLNLAHERDLSTVIHCRDCMGEIIDQMQQVAQRLGGCIRGVMHSFTGSWEDAEACLELGLHVSFAGMVTFTNKTLDPMRDVAARVPLDRLLIETDSPYLSPHPYRGQTNEPAHVAFTAARLAEIRGLSLAQFAQITTANARKLFGLPGDIILSKSQA
jgi:TatD DNase family protein